MRRSMRRRPTTGLVGSMARTAAIVGTASATSNAVNQRAMARQQAQVEQQAQSNAVAELQQQVNSLEAQQFQPTPASENASPAGGEDLVSKLQQLAELRSQGILTDDEFAAAKARVLGS